MQTPCVSPVSAFGGDCRTSHASIMELEYRLQRCCPSHCRQHARDKSPTPRPLAVQMPLGVLEVGSRSCCAEIAVPDPLHHAKARAADDLAGYSAQSSMNTCSHSIMSYIWNIGKMPCLRHSRAIPQRLLPLLTFRKSHPIQHGSLQDPNWPAAAGRHRYLVLQRIAVAV